MYAILALAKLIAKINHPEYSLGLSLKIAVKHSEESENSTTCHLLVGIRSRDGKLN